MTWDITFEAENGTRILRKGYFAIEAGWGDPNVPYDEVLWWSEDERRWVGKGHLPASSCAPCRSVAAFKSHLRRHHASLAGRKIRLISRFVGHDAYAQEATA